MNTSITGTRRLRSTRTLVAASRRRTAGPLLGLGVLASLALTPTTGTAAESHTTPQVAAAVGGEEIVLPQFTSDPLEPANRVVWGVNRGILTGVVKPTATFYRALLPTPVRKSISHLGHNVQFPGRLLNNLLQGNWNGAGVESERFLCNTVVGGGGLFDVATRFKIGRSPADFGRTFAHWGWQPNWYLMLPVFGPSNERDGLGLVGDSLANPLTYFNPYSYANYGFSYNKLSDSVDSAVRFAQSENDPYYFLRYAASFTSDHRAVDFEVHGDQDPASLQTLGAVFFSVTDVDFPARGPTRSVLIPTTGKRLKFTFWLQPKKSPVVYLVPGLGAHRLNGPVQALAELLYQHGYGVVCVSSAFHPEFIEHASTAALPAYAPVDAHDLHVALTAIDQRLRRYHADQMGSRALMGYSMGAFHSLFIAAGAAATGSDTAPLIDFDRYVAIDPPVRLLHGLEQLDSCFQAPLGWPSAERTEKIRNSFLKVAALAQMESKPTGAPPFSAMESRFLIGGAFRLVLRDTIYSSQRRTNLHVLSKPLAIWNRQEIYQEIMQLSYHDYYSRLAAPYYLSRGIDLTVGEAQTRATDLRTYGATLKRDPRVRVVANRNDILLAGEDVSWMEQTFTPDRLTLFDQGGHLGNLAQPTVQEAVVRALDGL